MLSGDVALVDDDGVLLTRYSALFKAFFAKETIENHFMAGQGADANFINEHFLSKILKTMSNAKILRYLIDQIYQGVTGEPCVACSKRAAPDVQFKIRHCSSLVLKNDEWMVVKKSFRFELKDAKCSSRKDVTIVKISWLREINTAKRLT